MAGHKKAKNPAWQRLRTWWRHRWVRVLAYSASGLGIIALLLVILTYTEQYLFPQVKNPMYGVSFSEKRSKELGLDWKANYLALLDDMQFKHLRLMSYWDTGEPSRGHFDFTDLDWQFTEATKRGVKISLSIGLRQPRWPECHEPDWAFSLHGNEWKQALYAYIEIVTMRYRDNPALESWQLENEGMNNWFGTCDPPDRQRLVEEFTLLKKWDPHHKVVMSLSDEHGLPLGPPTPDEFGFSVYRIVWNDKIPPHGYIVYPTPIWYHRLRAAIIEAMYHKPIIIHEMQMEPWGPYDTKYMSITEQDQSMSISQIADNFRFGRQIGMREIYLWGGEWWYWRKAGGDPRIWDAVKDQLHVH